MSTLRYDMPVSFGPSLIPDCTTIASAEVVIISFLTESPALESLLPPGFALSGDPIVSVSFISYPDVDYLRGRGYQELVISFQCTYPTASAPVFGGFSPVLWVDDAGALMAGREYMGLPKLLAKLDIRTHAAESDFECREYDSRLLKGRAYELEELSSERLARVRERSQEVRTFGWKYIPGEGGKADLAYPLVNVMRWNYSKAWSGKSEIEFLLPSIAEAPFSSRIAARLSLLPIKEMKRSFMAVGSAVIDRLATRRLA